MCIHLDLGFIYGMVLKKKVPTTQMQNKRENINIQPSLKVRINSEA